MVFFLRFLIWPILWGIVAVGSYLLDLPIWVIAWEWWWSAPAANTGTLVGAYFLWRFIVHEMRFIYALLQAPKLICLKVILPRSDSKLDQEKRTEKDFKEKVAIMEQLYRALWEIRSLTFW